MITFLETFLYSVIAYFIVLLIIMIGYVVLFVLTDEGDILFVMSFVLIFVIIFAVIYRLRGV